MIKFQITLVVLVFFAQEKLAQITTNTTNTTNITNTTNTTSQQPIPITPIVISQVCKNYQIPYFNFTTDLVPAKLTTKYSHISSLQEFKTYQFTQYSIERNCYHINYESRTENGTIYSTLPLQPTITDYSLKITFSNFDSPNKAKTYNFVYPITDVSAGSKTDKEYLYDVLFYTGARSGPQGAFGFFQNNENFFSIIPKIFPFPITAFGKNITNLTSLTCPDWVKANYTFYRFNCLTDQDDEYAKYSYITLVGNFAFWALVIFMVVFIVISNYYDEDVEITEKIKDNYLLAHPVMSLHLASDSQTFPRRPRITMIFSVACAIFWFNAIIDYRFMNTPDREDISLVIRLLVLGIFSALFGLIFEFIFGSSICLYYRTNKVFTKKFTENTDYDQKKFLIEKYEESNFQMLHVFYFLNIILALFFIVSSVYWIYWFSTDDQAWWLLQGVIGIAFKYLLIDVILMFLAKMEGIRKVLYFRGYLPDYYTMTQFDLIKKQL